VVREASGNRTWPSRRGSGDGTHARVLVRNKGSLRWVLIGLASRQQRLSREGRGRPGQMADGFVVPMKLGNAGGGKGP
jgi:hypothetical protein